MQRSREATKKQKRGFKGLCCRCRLSVSSSEEAESSNSSERFQTISSIAHAMVQERLDQIIRERPRRREDTKFVVMVAMEKSSCDPRQDFRDSMERMIVESRIREAKDLRRLLDYYLSMNSGSSEGSYLRYSTMFVLICFYITKGIDIVGMKIDTAKSIRRQLRDTKLQFICTNV